MGKERLIETGRQGWGSTKELIKNNKVTSLCVGLSGAVALSGLAAQAVTEFKTSIVLNATILVVDAAAIGVMKLKSNIQSKGRGRLY